MVIIIYLLERVVAAILLFYIVYSTLTSGERITNNRVWY